eukprot:s257_g5.t1
MTDLEDLWSALRSSGLEVVAPTLIRNGVTSLNLVALKADTLHEAGLSKWQIEAVLAAASQPNKDSVATPEDPSRRDLPVRQPGKRANLQAALEAAQPNQRQRAIQLLEQHILARSTNPAYEARLLTYLAICRAWKCFAASLKAGGYRSAGVYFQAVSILRGLGSSQLKDAFDAFLINAIQPSDDFSGFSFSRVDHVRDMTVLGLWYMMRESEMAGARSGDLQLDGRQVCLTIPLHKTDQRGKYTQRVLVCSCGARAHNLCAWQSAERNLVRLEAHPHRANSQCFPLFPTADGLTAQTGFHRCDPLRDRFDRVWELMEQSPNASLDMFCGFLGPR